MRGLKAWQQALMAAIHLEKPERIVEAEQGGFSLYRGSYLAGLTTVLTDIYPVVRALVGDVFFKGLTREYIYNTPLRQWDLNRYGCTFPHYIEHHQACRTLFYLAEVAYLEWACHWALNAPPVEEFDSLKWLQSCPKDDYAELKFDLLPHMTILSFKYQITKVWHRHQEPLLPEETIDISGGGEQLVVWARGGELCFTPITDAEKFLLESFQTGKTLGEIAEACEVDHRPLITTLGDLLQKRWIIASTCHIHVRHRL
jgi:hypothetical protein